MIGMKLTAPPPLEDLNMLVATRVFGLDEQPWSNKVCCPYCGNRGRYCGQRSWCDRCEEWYYSAYKYYDSNIEDAMLVVEKMRERFGVGTTIRMPQHYGGEQVMVEMNVPSEGSWLVWDKRKPSQSEAIGSEFELIWSKAKHKRRILRHDWFGFLSSDNAEEARNRVHPTQKPTSLLVELITLWNLPSPIVDLYAGSGTTLVAAENLNRTCYAMEISPEYCAVTLERMTTAFPSLKIEREAISRAA